MNLDVGVLILSWSCLIGTVFYGVLIMCEMTFGLVSKQ